MDPFSIAVGSLTLLQIAEKISHYALAVYKSKTEQEQFKDVYELLSSQLDQFVVEEKKARQNPDNLRYREFLAVLESSRQVEPGKVVPDPDGKGPGASRRLKDDMERMKTKLETKHGSRDHVRKFWWYFSRKEFQHVIQEMREWINVVKSILLFAVQMDTNDRVRNIQDQNLDISSYVRDIGSRLDKADKRKEKKAGEEQKIALAGWLSPLKFRERQSALLIQSQITLIEPSLFSSDEFRWWIKGRSWLLHCQGKPGAGKTLLCAASVHHLEESFKKENLDIPVLAIYLNYKEQGLQSLYNLIGSLLKQLVQHEAGGFLSSEAQSLYRGKWNESRPTLEDYVRALSAEIECFGRVAIIVDALDEALPNLSPRLLQVLHDLPEDKASVMITSQRTEDEPPKTLQIQCDNCRLSPLKVYFRCDLCKGENKEYYLCQRCKDKEHYCEHEDQSLSEPREVLVDVEPSEKDIRLFVQADLETELKLGATGDDDYSPSTFGTTPLGRLCRQQPSLQKEIIENVIAKADRMYALAALYMNSFKSLGLSEAEIIKMLDDPPEGYSGFYENYLKRISGVGIGGLDGHASALGMKVLLWVACTKRPLRFRELQDALAVELKGPGFAPAARNDKATIVRVTAGLVTILDNDEATVRFTHGTVQKYLDENRGRWFPNASAEITQIALHYLSLHDLSEPCQGDWEDKDLEWRKLNYPFLEYAYQHWGDHAKDAGLDPDTQDAVKQFVSDPKKIAACIQASWYLKSESPVEWDVRKGANSLHVCAWFGLTHALSSVLDEGMNVDSKTPQSSQTPLMYACRRGHVATVATLLERGACVDIISKRGGSALFEAVFAHETQVLNTLIIKSEPDVNAANAQYSGQTALMIAVQEGQMDIIRALLTKINLNINMKDRNDNTALCHAIVSGRPEVALYILDHAQGLDLNSQNWKGSSALMLAATKGQADVVGRLLSKGADTIRRDKEDCGTAILRAVDEGQLGVLETMIKHRVDIHCLDDRGRTLLHSAAFGGWDDIVRLLLEKGLHKNAKDKKGMTPLHDASRNANDECTVITTLIAFEADTSLEDNKGRTPWTVAWQNGNRIIMKVLDGKNPYELTEHDLSGEYPNAEALPVWSLAQLGNRELVYQAIVTRPRDIFNTDPDMGDTALHCAVDANQPDIVQLLLDAGVPANTKNNYDRTPLHVAAIAGTLPIMKLLLEAYNTSAKSEGETNLIEMKDRWGTTPLLMACEYRHLACTLLLIENGASIPSSKQPLKQSLFFSAIEFGNLPAVTCLVDMGADVEVKSVLGLTGLQMAKDGHFGQVETYLRAKNRSVKVGDTEGEIAEEEEQHVAHPTSIKSPPIQKLKNMTAGEEEKEESKEQGDEYAERKDNLGSSPHETTNTKEISTEDSLQLLQGLIVPIHSPGPTTKQSEEVEKETKLTVCTSGTHA